MLWSGSGRYSLEAHASNLYPYSHLYAANIFPPERLPPPNFTYQNARIVGALAFWSGITGQPSITVPPVDIPPYLQHLRPTLRAREQRFWRELYLQRNSLVEQMDWTLGQFLSGDGTMGDPEVDSEVD